MFRVGVIFGGDGHEREVSLKSGIEICNALRSPCFEVLPFRIDHISDLEELIGTGNTDIFFIALHGGWGENGQLQSFLDLKGIPYTGPDAVACEISMDKWKSKEIFIQSGIPTPEGILIDKASARAIKGEIPFNFRSGKKDLVVKPNNGGSTLGVSIVTSDQPEKLFPALEQAFQYDDLAIIETFIPGRELAVTIVEENGELDVLPVVEILPHNGFYSYEAKYSGGKSSYFAPAPMSERILKLVEQVASDAFKAIGSSVYSRVDIRLDPGGVPYILELNSVPGMTSTSLVPKAAIARGITFPEFLQKVLRLSWRKRSPMPLPSILGSRKP